MAQAQRSPVRERLGLLAHLRAVSRLARALRRVQAPPRNSPSAGQKLRAVLVPSTPDCDVGMRVRVFDWKPHLEARDFEVEVLSPCTEADWRSFSGEGIAVDAGYHAATVRALESHLEKLRAARRGYLHRGLLPF